MGDPLTTRTRPPEEASASSAQRVPALTILWHPDVERVGEQSRLRALVETGVGAISRIEPQFTPPAANRRQPLTDPHISRRGAELRSIHGGISIQGSDSLPLVIDGVPLQGARDFANEALDEGVVLDVAGRVLLLLHRLAPVGPRATRAGLVGESEAMERVYADVHRVADLDVPVLIRGETGSGKELVAHAIHQMGARSSRPLVAVNMGAVAPSTAASELFGHVRGAFTGAAADHDGHFVRAEGGTLFLDEIGETPADVQAMLLRTLETHDVLPLGGKRATTVDVRVIAATDAALEREIEEGRFREPLYFRLACYVITLPPLRARRDDIGRLLVHFLREELRSLGEERKLIAQATAARLWLPTPVVATLARHAWPGNVRQLRNIVRQLVIASRGSEVALPDGILAALAGEPATPEPPRTTGRKPAEIDETELLEALRRHGWRIGATADALGIAKSSLYLLIDKTPRIRKARDVSKDELVRCLEECAGDVDAAAARLEVSPRGLKLRKSELGL
jgi:two-component system nitrogen regulation response regulator GlnG